MEDNRDATKDNEGVSDGACGGESDLDISDELPVHVAQPKVDLG